MKDLGDGLSVESDGVPVAIGLDLVWTRSCLTVLTNFGARLDLGDVPAIFYVQDIMVRIA